MKNSDKLSHLYAKFLVFDEPAKHWQHLLKSQEWQQVNSAHASISQTGKYAQKSSLPGSTVNLNVLLAYEQARVFKDSALAELKNLHLENYLPEQRISYWQNTANVDLYFAQWLAMAEAYWPFELSHFNYPTPLFNDAHGQFFKSLAKTLKDEQLNWHGAIKTFRSVLRQHRNNLPADFLPRSIILVEGISEQILLPVLAASSDLNLAQSAALLLPLGGVNKVVRKYRSLRDKIRLPIFSLFDADAKPVAELLFPDIRNNDSLYIINEGELENLIELDFLVKQINEYLAQDLLFDSSKAVCLESFSSTDKRTAVLDKIWREQELGNFEKVKFANFIARRYPRIESTHISESGKNLLTALTKFLAANDNESTN